MAHVAGNTKVKFGKKTYTLRADFKAIDDIEQEFDDGIHNVIRTIGTGLRVGHMAKVSYHLLQAQHSDDAAVDSIEKVGQLIIDFGAVDFIGKMRDCLYGALDPNDPDVEEVGNDQKKPTERETKG